MLQVLTLLPANREFWTNKLTATLQAARTVVNKLQARHARAKVVVRDLVENPPPHMGRVFVSALWAQPEELTPAAALRTNGATGA